MVSNVEMGMRLVVRFVNWTKSAEWLPTQLANRPNKALLSKNNGSEGLLVLIIE